MNSFTPGIIIALLIMFLVGILVGYSLVQKRSRKQAEELKVSQRRLAEIEQSHELRLREATDRLRHDYESQLSTTIEHYQDQLSQKTIEMEQTYETRFRVMQQGAAPVTPQPVAHSNSGLAAAIPPPDAASEVAAQPSSESGVASASQTTPQRELRHLKQQYEMRLNEATQKLQKSYETQLAEHAKAAKAELQAEYDQQLATQYQEFEQEFAERQAELERQLAELRSESVGETATLASEINIPTPSEIMGTGDETTVALTSPGPAAEVIPTPAAQYTQSELDQQLAAAMQQAEVEFDQRLTEQLATQQVQFDRRLRELEADYQQRSTVSDQEDAGAAIATSPVDDLFSDDGYEDLVAGLSSETAETVTPEPEVEDQSVKVEDESSESDPEETSAEIFDDSTSDSSLNEEAAFIASSLDSENAIADADVDTTDSWTVTPTPLEIESESLETVTADDENLLSGEDLNDLFGESTAPESTDPLADADIDTSEDILTIEETSLGEVDDLFVEADTAVPQLDEMSAASEDTASDSDDDVLSDDDFAVLENSPAESVVFEDTASDSNDDLFGDDDLATALETTPVESVIAEDTAVDSGDDLFGDDDFATLENSSAESVVLEDTAADSDDDLFSDDDFATLETTAGESGVPDNSTSDSSDDLFGDDDFAEALEVIPEGSDTAETADSNIEDDLFGDNDLFAATPPNQSASDDALTEAEADLFGDNDFFADLPPAESSDNTKDDDDDDFGPLDLSDIS